jgi:hypoxanthine phosphoribosyltransferase
MKKRYLSWQDVETAVERLAINITLSEKQITSIIGLPRGGLIPAVMLSHKLNIPFSTEDEGVGEGYTLIVDDICDSGITLEEFKDYENVLTATLHYKSSACTEPSFWWRLAPENEWIVYPWENKDSETIQDYKK